MSANTIIDHVPTAEELHASSSWRRPNPSAYETKIPLRYTQEASTGEVDASPATLLKNLSDQLQFGNITESAHRRELVENGYRVAREIGDRAIQEKSEGAFRLLEAFRYISTRDVSFGDGMPDDDPKVKGGVRMREKSDQPEMHTRRFSLDFELEEAFEPGALRRLAQRRLEAEGLNLRSDHVSLLTFMKYAAHEASHVIQGATEVGMRNAGLGDNMSEYVLRANPDRRLHDDLSTDGAIYDERFAEGYGLLVVSEAARALGYDQSTVDSVTRAFELRDENLHHHDDEIAVGYARPLPTDVLISDLESIDTALRPDDGWSEDDQIVEGESTHERTATSGWKYVRAVGVRAARLLTRVGRKTPR